MAAPPKSRAGSRRVFDSAIMEVSAGEGEWQKRRAQVDDFCPLYALRHFVPIDDFSRSHRFNAPVAMGLPMEALS